LRIEPFRALRPRADLAERVACVPYDTVDSSQARRLAEGNPFSFLHVVRPEIDLPDGAERYGDDAYTKAAGNLARFQNDGVLLQDAEAACYVYRLRTPDHEQAGVVACCRIEDVERNVIRAHENTQARQEDDRARLLRTLGANVGPTFLTYRDRSAIDAAVAGAMEQAPLFDFTAVDGVTHTGWRVADVRELTAAFEEVPACYIADGHHRTAAAVGVGVEYREANPGHTGGEEYNRFLAVLFPSSRVRVCPYNRCVRDLHGMSAEQFLRAVETRFTVSEGASPGPETAGRISMYLGGRWYGLTGPNGAAGQDDRLDAALLQEELLGPVLGIRDPKTDPRIEFIGGQSPEFLSKAVDGGAAAVAFSLHAVTVEQVMDSADTGRSLPPKSTWFDPKIRSGLFIHTL
jgi:uncharacterized protein (DUF1015 family)